MTDAVEYLSASIPIELLDTVVRQEPLVVVKKEMMGSYFGGVEFEVERYDGWTNYLLWEKQVKCVLRAMGLNYLLLTQEEYDGDEEILEKRWKQEQVMAVNAVMLLYLKPHVIKMIDEYEDCGSLFTALKEKYYRVNNSVRLHKKFMLMGLRMKEGGKLQDHLDEFDSIADDLVSLGKEVLDEDKALFLLNSLPPSYQALKQVLIYPGMISISYHEVVRFLLSNDVRKRSLQSQPADELALSLNRGRSHQRTIGPDRFRSKSRSALRGNSQERKPVVCWKCSKPGHMKKDCRGN